MAKQPTPRKVTPQGNPRNRPPYDQGLWKPLVSLNKAGYTLLSEGVTVGG